jgi:hypothetical protein
MFGDVLFITIEEGLPPAPRKSSQECRIVSHKKEFSDIK